MDIEDDGVALGDLDQDAAARLAAMDKVKAKGGAIFGAAMAAGDAGGIEFTGDYIRIHAQRIADTHVEKAAKLAEDAELRAVVATTEAGARGGGAGGGKGRCWGEEVVGLVGVLRGRTSPRSSPRSSRTRKLLMKPSWHASASWRPKRPGLLAHRARC